MSNPFCESCNRIRLTADGNLKICLHSNKEFNLKDLIKEGKSDDEIEKFIRNVLLEKEESHKGMDNLVNQKNRSMIKIGG